MTIQTLRQLSGEGVSVLLADGTEIVSTLSVVTELRLYAGRELGEEQLCELRTLSERARARSRALEIVSRRLISEKELRDKLLQKGESEETAEYCTAWLAERGFLNDAEYAAAVVRHYAAKGYGSGRVRTELSRRGISRELCDEALEAMPASADSIDSFLAAKLKAPDDKEQVRKISNALYRRGYSWDEIRCALDRFRAEYEDING